MSTGIFTISLDLELYWGVRDKRSLAECKARLNGVPDAVDRMLQLFEETETHATWAAVGFMFHEDLGELKKAIPQHLPNYVDTGLDPYRYITEADDLCDWGHFAPSLIAQIARTPGQEVATHTYSHYYCAEDGQSVTAFRNDLEAAIAIADKKGISISSLVFPRNQVNHEFVPVLSEFGITAYRGVARGWVHAASGNAGANQPLKRAIRLIDSCINITGHHCYDLSPATLPVNIPASRLLRLSGAGSAALCRLHVRRIKQSMTHAAKTGKLFHLWWHPHNMGDNTDANVELVREVLEHHGNLHEEYGTRSLNMKEVSEILTDVVRR